MVTRTAIRCALLSSAFAWCLSTPAAAQRAAAAGANGGTQLLFLGTSGGPLLHAARSKPSTLLIVAGREYLIDCGIGTLHRMLEAGIDSTAVRTVFLTHLHSDHDLGLAEVMGNDFFVLSQRRSPERIAVYGPPDTKELVDAAFRFIAVSVRPFAAENPSDYRTARGQLASPFVAHEVARDGVIYQDDKIRVVAAGNSHYALMPPRDRRRLESYAYRIETPDGVVVFTGDTGPSDAVARLAEGADVLVAESSTRGEDDLKRFIDGMVKRNHWPAARARDFHAHFVSEHLNTSDVGQLARKAHVKAVVLHHYDPDDKADQAAYVAGVKKRFSGSVFAPDDLDRYCLASGTLAACPAAPAVK
ncbi:MAG TPA: MBL fold metallo-hydrolase [Vicinamibacterales bacterium]|nr:MBL fold metallo-hydrolase [Vicinamibacterales bacterium]